MFSGIVEETGIIKGIKRLKNLTIFEIQGNKVMKGLKIGDSIAVDGVCLTVREKGEGIFIVDLMKETLDKTTLGSHKTNSRVNLERALKVNSRLGGHFVQGHVDSVGKITRRIRGKNYEEFRIKIPKNLLKYIVPKGSVCIDGISLTVGEIREQEFAVYIIPHTLQVTTLGMKKENSKVNIETDLIAKHIVRLVQLGELNIRL